MFRSARSVVTVLLLTLTVATALAAPVGHETYLEVRVLLDAPGADAALRAMPGLDVIRFKAGSDALIVAYPRQLADLEAAGLRYEVVHEDLAAFYAMRAKGANFGLYHSYSEAGDWLDQMAAQYPDVVSPKWSIGQTGQGNDIWCVRVSDNPGVDEAGEPEILIDGMHHAREIMASEMALMLIDHLGAGYGVDPEITWLLDNREVYVVPVVNPDGFLYNELTDPNGGGMWRKNRRNNGDGSYGVDPNRNYPFEWVGPGSSTYPYDETYRGPYAGSEPEVQAMMALVNAHAFVTSQSFHTYSNLTLYPWGYTTSPCPDAATFAYMAGIMTAQNGYEAGPPGELLYTVNGGSFDWVYGAQTEHPRCFAFSSEIGGNSDGFWPDESRIPALFQENLEPSLYLIRSAGAFVQAHTPVVLGGDANGRLDPGESADLSFTLENRGVVDGAADVALTLATDDPYLQLLDATVAVGSLGALSSMDLTGSPFGVSVDAACPAGHVAKVTATLSFGGAEFVTAFHYAIGEPVALFADDFEGGAGLWTRTGTWAVSTEDSHSPSSSLTDSPGASYVNNSTSSATLSAGVPLGAACTLSFHHKYDIESGYDYGSVQISADGGAWINLASYSGTLNSWTPVSFDLSAYAGSTVRVRFLLETDYSVVYTGWHIDDVLLLGAANTDLPPAAPALLSPAEGETVPPIVALVVADSADPEGLDPVTYGFRVWSDAAQTQLVAYADGLAQGSGGATDWTVAPALVAGETYWWRAYAADAAARGDLGELRSFVVTTGTAVGDVVLGFDLRQLTAEAGERVRLGLDLPDARPLQLKVYNARGQVVRELAFGDLGSGRHVLTWDGRDGAGRLAASGVYFVKARLGNEALTRRVLLVEQRAAHGSRPLRVRRLVVTDGWLRSPG